jgi:hypothetical protein
MTVFVRIVAVFLTLAFFHSSSLWQSSNPESLALWRFSLSQALSS